MNQKAYVTCRIENEGLLKVAGSHKW